MIAAPENMTLGADGGDQNTPVATLTEQLPELLFVDIHRRQATALQYINTQQGAFQPHGLQHPLGG